MITAIQQRELLLAPCQQANAPRHISAASGLVFTDKYFYVVADDELHLAEFEAAGSQPGRLIRLLDGELPKETHLRKTQKPDFETLVRLPSHQGYPYGALLAMGSGSTAQRRRAVILGLDANNRAQAMPKLLHVDGIFQTLNEQIDNINIEGMLINGDEFQLLHRGNSLKGLNALIRFRLSELLLALVSNNNPVSLTPLAIEFIDLGTIETIPLTFTDGVALPNGDIVFSAVAENTQDTYNDGPCLGAVIGVLTREGSLRYVRRLKQNLKIEGLVAVQGTDHIQLQFVTDADNPNKPASLFTAALPFA